MYLKTIASIILMAYFGVSYAQVDSLISRITPEMDYRFRVEQDWDSQKSDGTLRDNRSRLRYRLRIGATYHHDAYVFGVRLRTGDQRKQQDPQLTLGKGLQEFGTLPVGFEKAYFRYAAKSFSFWIGKNTYPFEKSNELFWSDNVFPEGVTLKHDIPLKSDIFNKLNLVVGHFVLSSNDGGFFDDAYFQGYQASLSLLDDRVVVFPSMYLFRNIPNIPDGEHRYFLDYSILHIGSRVRMLKDKKLSFELDYYRNIEDYQDNTDISTNLQDQKTGYTIAIKYGQLEEKNDWLATLTYANLERYSILDYMAQNDWARWDYSTFNSPDGRLSNYQGIEVAGSYAITNKINLVAKYYLVQQLIVEGLKRENGQRFRFDIDVKF